jgi:putative addiction module killer protein
VYEIRRYRTSKGQVVVTDWLQGLRDIKGRIAIDRRILRMELGNLGDRKFCRDGVWEMRIDFGPGYRVYYAHDGARIIVLLCGGAKRTQSADIDRACEYWQDWQRRTET